MQELVSYNFQKVYKAFGKHFGNTVFPKYNFQKNKKLQGDI